MLRNIQKFLHVTFKIEECHDDVFGDTSDEEGAEEGEAEQDEEQIEESTGEKPQFATSFIYSCIGVGLQNFARKIE